MARSAQHDDLLARSTRYLDYFLAVAEAAKALTATLDAQAVVASVMQTITQLLEPKHWSLLFYDDVRNDLYFEVAVGEGAEALRKMRLPIGEGIAGWVALHKQVLVVPRVADDARFSRRFDDASNVRTASIVAAPLLCHGKLMGVIELIKDESDPLPYNAEHAQVLGPLADFAAIALNNARTFKRVEELTVVDEWTTLYNARFLQRFLADEVLRAQRYGREVSVLFFDLDGFKKVNDGHGHATGSALLRHVGLAVKRCVRETDKAIRYGGDEFVVVMPETPASGALTVAQRILACVAEAKLTTNSGAVVGVTASCGLACYPRDAADATTLLQAADKAMYEAKALGKNRIELAPHLSA